MRKMNVKLMLVLSGTMLLGGLFAACSDEENVPEPEQYSPYVTQVLDFRPAPGQFVNGMPTWKEGDTQETMNKKVLSAIGNNKKGMISLGGFGGYVVVGFDHTIENVTGERDFRVLGNAFYAEANPNPNVTRKGGSCEPGIVMVAYDKNKNGKPDDDEWYELAGSEYNKDATTRNYEITYYRPDENKEPVVDDNDPHISDQEYIRWTDNQNNNGYIPKNVFNADNSYFPQWISGQSITFKGTLLPDNGVNEGTAEKQYWVLYSYDWGYADNVPNEDEGSTFDIDWAVDKKGNKVNLPGVDFIKVYTGVRQNCGWLGEVSTEVCGVEDLHLLVK